MLSLPFAGILWPRVDSLAHQGNVFRRLEVLQMSVKHKWSRLLTIPTHHLKKTTKQNKHSGFLPQNAR